MGHVSRLEGSTELKIDYMQSESCDRCKSVPEKVMDGKEQADYSFSKGLFWSEYQFFCKAELRKSRLWRSR